MTTLKINLLALCILLSGNFSNVSGQIELKLTNFGFPNYVKIAETSTYRAFVIYKNEHESFFRMTPSDLYGISSDTLFFTVEKRKNENLKVNCKNCGDISFTSTQKNDTTFFEFAKGNRKISYYAFQEKKIHLSTSAQIIKGYERDTILGFIRSRNTFTRFATIPNERGINIALLDWDKNGIYDENDFVTLSTDNYFMAPKSSSFGGFIKNVQRMKINNTVYDIQVVDPKIPTLSIQVSPEKTYDIALTDSLPNFEFSGTTLFDELNTHEYVLFSYFNEYCLPCMQAVPELNALPNKVLTVAVYDGKDDLIAVKKKCQIQYPIDFCKNVVGHFQLNGFPNYVLINAKHEVAYEGSSLKELLALINP